MSLEKSERPWGSYEVLGEFPNYKVKTICAAVHTPEVIATYQAMQETQIPA